MKKLINSIKNSKPKMIAIILCIALLITSIAVFVRGKANENDLKNPDKAISALLDIFYSDDYNEDKAEILLGKSYKEYFGEISENSYKATYEELKLLEEGDLVRGKDAVELSNDYVDASLNLLKRVKKYEVISKQKIDEGYRFDIKVTPINLSDAYQKANVCATDLIATIEKEDPSFAELEGHELAVYYYCLAKGMNDVNSLYGDEVITNVTLKKGTKGMYIPDEDSLKKLISVAY